MAGVASPPRALLRGALLATTLLLCACGLNPFSGEEEQVGRPADSAAQASMQTYSLLTRAVNRQERLAERQAAAEAAETAVPESRIAGLPPADTPEIALRVRFSTEFAELDDAARADLAALGTQLQGSPDLPIRLLAYWSAEGEEAASTAKIMALKRAMLVRDYLTDQGLKRAPIEFPRVEGDGQETPDVIDVVLDGG